ncbi:MAG: hypothetical protein ACJAYS_001198 [Lentimonas sp.]|jgi:hypothetical protein
MNLHFLEEVESEFDNTVFYYEDQQPDLGKRFRDEVAHVLSRVVQDPFLWRERKRGYRRVNLPVFNHYIAYIIEANTVYVVAIASSSQHPDYWKNRLASNN